MDDSTTAGLWIPDFQHRESWKIDYGKFRSIMSAELYALDKGMTWLMLHKEILLTNKVVFLTDSRSSIEAMKNSRPRYQSFLLNNIKQKAQDLLTDTENSFEVTIQWIPSHVGIDGNEKADEIAKSAHGNHHMIPAVLDLNDVKAIIKSAQHIRWQLKYDLVKHNLHIGPIKPIIEKWPWSNIKKRQIETTLIRFRSGHVGLNGHLHRFNMAEDPLCQTCREPETIPHFFLTCRQYERQRIRLKTRLNRLNITDLNYITLLGGSQHSPEKKVLILKAVGDYLQDTGRLGSL